MPDQPLHLGRPLAISWACTQKLVFMLRLLLGLFYLVVNPVTAQQVDSKFVDVDGIQLEYVDIGSGQNTLVIESGVGMGVAYWQPLLSDLSKLNIRTVIYSRAGNGKSSAADNVALAPSIHRLKQLLEVINAGHNLILLGHSYGGLHVRAFAASYPDSVKGLLLLDPSHESFGSELSRFDKSWAERDALKLNTMMSGQSEWTHLQFIYQQNTISDNGITNRIPTVIVTSSKLNESGWWIGHSTEGKRLWRELHQSLINKNPNSVHIVTDDTGHNVPLENKTLFFKSIDTLLSLVHGV